MSMEYFDSHNSPCSNSYDSCNRRRIFSGEFKSNDFDNDSTKASSSSIQESIANMSNSLSIPEDNLSDNAALLSPFSKQVKSDFDKDFDMSSEYLSKYQSDISRSISSKTSDLNSIEDTIECVLSKIREDSEVAVTCSSIKYDANNILSSNNSQVLNNSNKSKTNSYYNNYITRNDNEIYQSSYSRLDKSNPQSFYNYGNYKNQNSFYNNVTNQNNLMKYSPFYDKYVPKNNNLLNEYQCQNTIYNSYITNSYLNQAYLCPELNQTSSLQNNQIYQRSHSRNNTMNDNKFEHSGINFKTPQQNFYTPLDQSILKKRPNKDQVDTIPTKKRKVSNQQLVNNTCEYLIKKLKALDHKNNLIYPALSVNKSLLPPLEFMENKITNDNQDNLLQYKKYKSYNYFTMKPKRFKSFHESDKFLSNFITENILDKVLLSVKDCVDCDYVSDIICGSPQVDVNNHELLSHLNVVETLRDVRSPELSTSFKEKCNAQFNNYKAPSNNLKLDVIPDIDNDDIAELHNQRTYTQLTGSFLKRTKINSKFFSTNHIEEAVSAASLSASKLLNSCYQCGTFLTGLSCVKINGKKVGFDSDKNYLFCSVICYSTFKSNIISDNNLTNVPLINNSKNDSKIVIKTTLCKTVKNERKHFDFEQHLRPKLPIENNLIKATSLHDNRDSVFSYKYFNSQSIPILHNDMEKENEANLLQQYSGAFKLDLLIDKRACVLCLLVGDDNEDVCGRLINIGCDRWIHLNCGLWCFDVFETVSGSLMGVHSSIDKALKNQCSFCNLNGAGIPCYRNKCPCVYHVPCAYKTGCIFYTDRGMYCPLHAVRNHPMHLSSLKVDRHVSVFRDESALVAEVILEDQHEYKIRIGTLILNRIGQLLPEQLWSGHYNSRSIIYPIGYHVTRIFWSSLNINKRCKYECFIDENDNRPYFKVIYNDDNNCEIVVTDYSCDKLWKCLLNKIAKLRENYGLTKLFSQYLSGEQLYGLNEPHIIRIIESLPGVEMMENYVFKFGKMQLITEMPLAINPTGSARTEPKLRTYVRKPQSDVNQCGILKTKCSQQFGFSFDSINLIKYINIPIHNPNSRTNQYKQLKYEWVNNVTLSRSKIQGLGLFAAKDFDKSVMIIEYIGETIRNEVGNCREKLYQSRNNSIYMFRLNDDVIIDATVNGGLARYINHSCNPNCVAEFLSLDCGGRIIISTKQRIERGEELTYDYKFDFEDNKSNLIPCLCGAINCRGWMN